MYTILSVLIFIACVLLILVVLVQNSKGGGLAANFSSSNQIMGVRKTTDFLEKFTWILAGALLVLSIGASLSLPRGTEAASSAIESQIENIADPTQLPAFPTPGAADGAVIPDLTPSTDATQPAGETPAPTTPTE